MKATSTSYRIFFFAMLKLLMCGHTCYRFSQSSSYLDKSEVLQFPTAIHSTPCEYPEAAGHPGNNDYNTHEKHWCLAVPLDVTTFFLANDFQAASWKHSSGIGNVGNENESSFSLQFPHFTVECALKDWYPFWTQSMIARYGGSIPLNLPHHMWSMKGEQRNSLIERIFHDAVMFIADYQVVWQKTIFKAILLFSAWHTLCPRLKHWMMTPNAFFNVLCFFQDFPHFIIMRRWHEIRTQQVKSSSIIADSVVKPFSREIVPIRSCIVWIFVEFPFRRFHTPADTHSPVTRDCGILRGKIAQTMLLCV